MSTIWAFDNIKNNHTLYGVESCIKKFCSSHRKHAVNIIHFEKKGKVTVNKPKLLHDATVHYICVEKFVKDKNYQKVRDLCHYTGVAPSICNLRFNVPNENLYFLTMDQSSISYETF